VRRSAAAGLHLGARRPLRAWRERVPRPLPHSRRPGAPVSEGKATRVYARINEDGSLSSQPIPVEMLTALNELGSLTHLKPNSGATRLGAER